MLWRNSDWPFTAFVPVPERCQTREGAMGPRYYLKWFSALPANMNYSWMNARQRRRKISRSATCWASDETAPAVEDAE